MLIFAIRYIPNFDIYFEPTHRLRCKTYLVAAASVLQNPLKLKQADSRHSLFLGLVHAW